MEENTQVKVSRECPVNVQKRVPELHLCLFSARMRTAQENATGAAANAIVNMARVLIAN